MENPFKDSCFIVAEAGVNHNGRLDLAEALVEMAVSAGADAIKFQTFKSEMIVTLDAPKAEYQKMRPGRDESQFEMLRGLELSEKDHHHLVAHCKKKGIRFFSTPFHNEAADFLDELGVEIFKVGSGDLDNLPLLRHIAKKNKPIILSTGMSDLNEIEASITIVRENQARHCSDVFPDLMLLHCVSCYPVPFDQVNLKALKTLEKSFGLPVGFSDHTPGTEISLAAVAMGATVIEKHFTLDRTLPGPDQALSLEPDEFRRLVEGIRHIEAAMGDGVKRCQACEAEVKAVARKSIVATRDIHEGEFLTEENIGVRRPGTGIPPSQIPRVIHTKAVRSFKAGDLIWVT